MNNHYYEKEPEYVRPADAVRRERLLPPSPMRGFIPYTDNDEDEQFRRAISESEMDFELEHALVESALEEGRKKAREARTRNFANLKTKFSQFKRLDKDNQEFYATLLGYIESYESGDLIQARVGAEFYRKFRNILYNIRVLPEDKKRILSFIVPEDNDDDADWSGSGSGSDSGGI